MVFSNKQITGIVFLLQGSEYNDIYPLQGMGSEYLEADRDRSASLHLFILCQQTRRKRLNEIRAADNQKTAI